MALHSSLVKCERGTWKDNAITHKSYLLTNVNKFTHTHSPGVSDGMEGRGLSSIGLFREAPGGRSGVASESTLRDEGAPSQAARVNIVDSHIHVDHLCCSCYRYSPCFR